MLSPSGFATRVCNHTRGSPTLQGRLQTVQRSLLSPKRVCNRPNGFGYLPMGAVLVLSLLGLCSLVLPCVGCISCIWHLQIVLSSPVPGLCLVAPCESAMQRMSQKSIKFLLGGACRHNAVSLSWYYVLTAGSNNDRLKLRPEATILLLWTIESKCAILVQPNC